MDTENSIYKFCIIILSIFLILCMVTNLVTVSKAVNAITSVSCNNVESTKVIIIYRDNPDTIKEEVLEEEILEEVEEVLEETKEVVDKELVITPGVLTKRGGVNYFDGHKETYYNLSMKKVVSNAQNRGIEGDYWEREDGAKMIGDYIMVAADQSIHPYGSLVETSLGTGIVVDTGTFIKTNPQQIDIATTW